MDVRADAYSYLRPWGNDGGLRWKVEERKTHQFIPDMSIFHSARAINRTRFGNFWFYHVLVFLLCLHDNFPSKRMLQQANFQKYTQIEPKELAGHLRPPCWILVSWRVSSLSRTFILSHSLYFYNTEVKSPISDLLPMKRLGLDFMINIQMYMLKYFYDHLNH